MKRLLGVVLAGMLVFSAVPMTANASDATSNDNICSAESYNSLSEEKETNDSASETASGADSASEVLDSDSSVITSPSVEDSGNDSDSDSDSVSEDTASDTSEVSTPDSTVTVLSTNYEKAASVPTVSYRAHVQNIGWMNWVSDGTTAGTTGQSKRVEALEFKINGDSNLGIIYQAHVQNIGWQESVANGATTGTTGKSLQIEAVRINLTGSDASKYDIYYCTHIQDYGWLNWAKNGAMSGSKGISKRVEAVQIKILPKGSAAPASLGLSGTAVNNDGIILQRPDTVTYCSISQGQNGFASNVQDGAVSGITGQSKPLEQIKVSDSNDNINISYSVHVANVGWTSYVSEGNAAGVKGSAIQAVKMKITGSDASKYDIFYCVHSQDYGWFNWVKDDETAGTTGLGYRVEAYAVMIVPKGNTAPAKLGSLSIGGVDSTTALSYSAHVQNIGWMSPVSDGATAGTTGRSLQMEALKITKSGAAISGSVNYKAHVENIGWMNTVSDGAIAGTTGRSLRVEAVSISLSGGISEAFDVYYRVHVQNIGWTGWAVNGANCGSQGISKRIEAIEIKLVAKGKEAPGFTNNTFFKGFQSGIDVSKWQGDIDWSKASKAINFAIIRCNEHSGNNYAGTDPKYFQNMKGAKKYNVPVGVYYYSVATNTDEAVAEANLAVSLVQQAGGVSLPIFIDIEADNQKALTNDQRTAIVKAFCNRVQGAGYQAGVYTSYSWFADYKGGKALLNTAELTGYTIWCARYNASSCGLPYQYSFWQYSSQGSIPGIKANVDLDYRYF